MAGVHIVTDSAATLPRDADLNYGITILPYTLRWQSDRYQIGTDIGADELAGRWIEAPPDEVITTSSEIIRGKIRSVLDWGVDVVGVLAPQSLTPVVERVGSVVAEIGPDAPVSVIETAWMGPALGLMAISAAHAGAEGAPRPAVVELVREIDRQLHCVVLRPSEQEPGLSADDRPWRLDRLTGSRFEPVDEAQPLGSAMRAAVAFVSEHLQASAHFEGPLHMALFSAGADAETAALATYFEARHGPHELWMAPADPLLLRWLGVPALGIAWYRLPHAVEVAV